MTAKSLKTKTTRRAAKPADGAELADALRDIFHKLDNLLTDHLPDARGAANICELIGDDADDPYVKEALHAAAHHGQGAIDEMEKTVTACIEIIRGTKEHRAAIAEAEARLAAAEKGGAS